jgi:hypothetical protein
LRNHRCIPFSDAFCAPTPQSASAPDQLFAAEAFRNVILGARTAADAAAGDALRAAAAASPPLPPPADPAAAAGSLTVHFSVLCHRLGPGQRVALTGAPAALHCWDVASPLPCAPGPDAGEWRAAVRLPRAAFPLRFRFVVLDDAAGAGAGAAALTSASSPHASSESASHFHGGAAPEAEERIVTHPEPLAGRSPGALLLHCGPLAHARGPWRGAGVAVPVFSLRSASSVGCGDFLDLLPLVDLAADAGLRMVQLLPVNDTRCHGSWWDSYPYSCASTQALHPLYLRPQALAPSPLPPAAAAAVAAAAAELEALPAVDYERALAVKLAAARAAYDAARAPGGALAPGGSLLHELDAFVEANAAWLKPYGAFCYLRDVIFGTAEHWRWGALASPTPEQLARLTAPGADHAPGVRFTYYLQWQLHAQLGAAAAHAASRRVVLKGDLPIGVDKRSVDTWLAPHLFRMGTSTGAPPDAFDATGQNWGFPTYNWEEMARDGYAWWRARLAHTGRFFGALRVDHVLGFFRIWELPAHGVGGLLGRFRPALPLTRAELEARGLWDVERLVQPYVRRHLLGAALGPRAHEVACRFMTEEPAGSGSWRFRPEFGTEAALSAADGLQPRPGSPAWLVDELAATRTALVRGMRACRIACADLRVCVHCSWRCCATCCCCATTRRPTPSTRGTHPPSNTHACLHPPLQRTHILTHHGHNRTGLTWRPRHPSLSWSAGSRRHCLVCTATTSTAARSAAGGATRAPRCRRCKRPAECSSVGKTSASCQLACRECCVTWVSCRCASSACRLRAWRGRSIRLRCILMRLFARRRVTTWRRRARGGRRMRTGARRTRRPSCRASWVATGRAPPPRRARAPPRPSSRSLQTQPRRRRRRRRRPARRRARRPARARPPPPPRAGCLLPAALWPQPRSLATTLRTKWQPRQLPRGRRRLRLPLLS